MHQDIDTVLQCLGHIYLIYCCSDPTDPVFFLCVKKKSGCVNMLCACACAVRVQNSHDYVEVNRFIIFFPTDRP